MPNIIWVDHQRYFTVAYINICLRFILYLDFAYKCWILYCSSISWDRYIYECMHDQIAKVCTWKWMLNLYTYFIDEDSIICTHTRAAYVTNPRRVDAIPDARRVFGFGERLQFRLLIEALRQNLSVGGGATKSPENLPLI